MGVGVGQNKREDWRFLLNLINGGGGGGGSKQTGGGVGGRNFKKSVIIGNHEKRDINV